MGLCPKPRRSAGSEFLLRFLWEAAEPLVIPIRTIKNMEE